jgi:hypothetical protein
VSKRLTELAKENPRRRLKKIKVVRKRPIRKKVISPSVAPTAAAIPEVVSVEHVVHLGPVTPAAPKAVPAGSLNPLIPTVPLPKGNLVFQPTSNPVASSQLLNPVIPQATPQPLLLLNHPGNPVPAQARQPIHQAVNPVPILPPRPVAQHTPSIPTLRSGAGPILPEVGVAHPVQATTVPALHKPLHVIGNVGPRVAPEPVRPTLDSGLLKQSDDRRYNYG